MVVGSSNHLTGLVRPFVRFLLSAGVSYRQLIEACKEEFIVQATNSYGLRGRPTNVSRVAAITGITRKEVRAVRERVSSGASEPELVGNWNPLAQILHHWHTDPEYLDRQGKPILLEISGPEAKSFDSLSRRLAGDIPPGAMLAELKRANAVEVIEERYLLPLKRHYAPTEFDESFVRSMTFSLSNLTATLARNAELSQASDKSLLLREGLLERYVWAQCLRPADREAFLTLAEKKAEELLSELDVWIGDKERDKMESDTMSTSPAPFVGVGIYLFEDSQAASGKADGNVAKS